jgi:hypothetical protein
MESDLRERLNEFLGPGTVEQIVFRHAGWQEHPWGSAEDPAESQPVQPGPLSAQQRKALAAVEDLGLPADIRDRILRAMRVAFVRGQHDSVR